MRLWEKRTEIENEIMKIYTYASLGEKNTLLHRSAFKNSAKVRQTFSYFYKLIFKNSLIFQNVTLSVVQNSRILMKFSGISEILIEFFTEETKIA